MSHKTIFITGAGAGIGRATAQLFHARGYAVGLYDVDAGAVDSLAQSLGGRTAHGGLDVRDASAFTHSVNTFVERFGRLDVLHNNAGILKMGNFDALTLEEHHRTLDVNVNGVIHGVAAALPHLRATARRHGRSRIVNMCSASAIYGVPGFSSYSASKFAVRALTESLNVELEPDGVIVSSILPLFVGTGMVHAQEQQTPLFRGMGVAHTPEDIAKLVWAASQGSRVHYYGKRSLAWGDGIAHVAPRLARLFLRRGARS